SDTRPRSEVWPGGPADGPCPARATSPPPRGVPCCRRRPLRRAPRRWSGRWWGWPSPCWPPFRWCGLASSAGRVPPGPGRTGPRGRAFRLVVDADTDESEGTGAPQPVADAAALASGDADALGLAVFVAFALDSAVQVEVVGVLQDLGE